MDIERLITDISTIVYNEMRPYIAFTDLCEVDDSIKEKLKVYFTAQE